MKNNIWWDLRWSKRFLSELFENFRTGKNSIIYLPEFFINDLDSILRINIETIYRDKFSRTWYSLDLNSVKNNSDSPINIVSQYFDLNSRNIKFIVDNKMFMDKIIWIPCINNNLWQNWKEFIEEYADYCRNHGESDRDTIFCIKLQGNNKFDFPSNPIIKNYTWQDYVIKQKLIDDIFDIYFFTASIFNKNFSGLKKKLIISTIAHLALWDPEVSDRLMDNGDIENPFPVLENIAKERKWDSIDSNSSEAWDKGIKNRIDGKEKIHSAYLAIQKGIQELNIRIWNAQMEVLLPFIEQKRKELLDKLINQLKPPFSVKRDGETVSLNNIYDLRIGDIPWQITEKEKKSEYFRYSNDAKFVKKSATILSSIRNALAHIEPLNEELMQQLQDVI